MNNKIIKLIFFILVFSPLLIYLGPRSFVAQDEGYYALQSRWILESGNWLAPQWWNNIVYDRSIGIQWLIAFSQLVFGRSIWAAHLPTTIFAFSTLYFTSEISKRIIDDKYYWISPLILATSFLWLDNAHLSTQDMALLSIECFGLFTITQLIDNKSDDLKSQPLFFLIGLTVGLGFLFKTFMIFVPILAIFPFLFLNHRSLFTSRFFLIGILTGFIPVLIWLFLSYRLYGLEAISLLFSKFYHLSSSSQYSQSNFFYIWKIALQVFPYSLFIPYGVYIAFNYVHKKYLYILLVYPFIIFALLSLFNTKTSYYALQLMPSIAIISSIGIYFFFSHPRSNKVFARAFLLVFSIILFFLIGFLLIFQNKFIVLGTFSNSHYNLLYSVLILALAWLLPLFRVCRKHLLVSFLLGPYLALMFVTQAGFLTNRSHSVPAFLDSPPLNDILSVNKPDFIFNAQDLDSDAFSQLVKIALYSPNLGTNVELNDVNTHLNYYWIQSSDLSSMVNYRLINDNPTVSPWVLVRNY